MPRAWRIVKSSRAATAFDGEGGRLHGGRWNSPGTAMIYTASSQSLAALEVLVHLQDSRLLQQSYSAIAIDFDDKHVEVLALESLPKSWRQSPSPNALLAIGDRWSREGRSPALQVPSAIIPDEPIYLLNPQHPAFPKLRTGKPKPFDFDPRLK